MKLLKKLLSALVVLAAITAAVAGLMLVLDARRCRYVQVEPAGEE